jgi:ABC-2 type transport system ATP-binding protein
MADLAVRARDLQKSFGRTVALDSISFTVLRGSVYCIAGPNGSGKTTLLNILAGISSSDTGALEVNGTVGYCRQNPLLYSDLTVSQNISLFSEMLAAKKGQPERIISLLGLSEFSERKVGELSSGTKKKAELCISFLQDPDIFVLDEPTTGLDRKSSEELLSFIRKSTGGKTVILATHQLSDVEGLCTHLMVLKKGRKAYEGRATGSLEKTYKKIIRG